MSRDKLTKAEVLSAIEESGLIPVFYHDDVEVCVEIIDACQQAGLRVIEFTNRGDQAIDNFREINHYRKSHFPNLVLGIGSIFDSTQTQQYIDLKADFIVSPIFSPEMAQTCHDNDMLWIPGAGTTTEVYNAKKAGAQLIKVFPGDVLGPKFVKSVLGPMPDLKLMPTGGVVPAKENLTAWYKAGVKTVGMGSQLFRKDWIANGEFDRLTEAIKATKNIVNSIKEEL